MGELSDTGDIREKMLVLWAKLDQGKLTHAEARVHIGIARTVLDTLKVEIAAAHLQDETIGAVSVKGRKSRASVKRIS